MKARSMRRPGQSKFLFSATRVPLDATLDQYHEVYTSTLAFDTSSVP